MDLQVGGISIPLRSGALIPVLVMIPNVIWMLLPKVEAGEQDAEPLALTIVENLGRAAVLILPFFYTLDLSRKGGVVVAVGMGAALAIYYAAWVRYFVRGRPPELFRAPLLGIPLPLAVAPIAFLTLSSYLMGSWWMLGASILFGVVHIWVSAVSL